MSTSFAESEAQYRARIDNERIERDRRMSDPQTSPLSEDQRRRFSGLSYFPIDMNFKISARLIRTGDVSTQLTMTDGSQQSFTKYGSASFILNGNNITLDIFRDKGLPELSDRAGRLFIPFTDRTTGSTTSETGRYIPLDEPAGGDVVEVDFNRAYNTYNGYNRNLVSVTPPNINKQPLDFSIGQRKFEDR